MFQIILIIFGLNIKLIILTIWNHFFGQLLFDKN